ncbi:hypothetical protein CPB84DRAFT_858755 [Gymnopilus junonius]|uniref:Uncharacterized protein n=1 Tax=Gymnopilus junonius TaxID=109634 RepID=A0A9P5NRQ3_GYMJU|nr:hypothetical protein CPB84DRAFT_858755 [Gymnopilus junonius]
MVESSYAGNGCTTTRYHTESKSLIDFKVGESHYISDLTGATVGLAQKFYWVGNDHRRNAEKERDFEDNMRVRCSRGFMIRRKRACNRTSPVCTLVNDGYRSRVATVVVHVRVLRSVPKVQKDEAHTEKHDKIMTSVEGAGVRFVRTSSLR